jgi:hypothetical protein
VKLSTQSEYLRQARELSLTARLAVGLHCFSRYCKRHELVLSLIDKFLDDLWEFPLAYGQRWAEWEEHHSELVYSGLGDPLPVGLEPVLKARGIDPGEFHRFVSDVMEIVFSSFYGAADSDFSYKCLAAVIEVTRREGIELPPLGRFSGSKFADRAGWGEPIAQEERDAWRNG